MPSTEWIRLTIKCSEEITEIISESLEALEAQSISLTFPVEGACSMVALFDEIDAQTSQFQPIIESMQANKDVFHVEQDTLKDRDWELETKKSFQPLYIKDKLMILAPWHSAELDSIRKIVITPGLSFGTGHHPTTQMCLEFLCEMDLTDSAILDYGCGSGILALSALALGARFAWGVDIDLDAITESEKNARQNNLASTYRALQPSQIPENLAVNITVANLYSEIIIELATKLTGYIRNSGWVIATGILSEQIDETLQAFPSPSACTVHLKEEWAMLAMKFEQNANSRV